MKREIWKFLLNVAAWEAKIWNFQKFFAHLIGGTFGKNLNIFKLLELSGTQKYGIKFSEISHPIRHWI